MMFDIYLEIGMGVWCILVSVRLNGRTCVRAASVWADMVMSWGYEEMVVMVAGRRVDVSRVCKLLTS